MSRALVSIVAVSLFLAPGCSGAPTPPPLDLPDGGEIDGGADAGPPERSERWIEASWSVLSPMSRGVSRLVHHEAEATTYLIGGQSLGPLPIPDVWRWRGHAWEPMGISPAANRKNFGVAYDRDRARIVVFGGIVGGLAATPVALDDTWELVDGEWAQLPVTGPSARSGHAMTYDEARHQTLVFGGYGARAYDDLYAWDGTAWIELEASVHPQARFNAHMVYDTVHERVLLFGGLTEDGTALDDLWAWDGATWTELAPQGERPPGRGFYAMAFDRRREVVVVYGGTTTWPPFINQSNTFGDMWELDERGWRRVETTEPGLRSGAAMTYDAEAEELVLFGGVPDGTTLLGDTWLYRGCNGDDSACEGSRVLECVDGRWADARDCEPATSACVAGFGSSPRAECAAVSACLTHAPDTGIARYDASILDRYRVISVGAAGPRSIRQLVVLHAPLLASELAIPDPFGPDAASLRIVVYDDAGGLYVAVSGTLRVLSLGTRAYEPYHVRLEGLALAEASTESGELALVEGGRTDCIDAAEVRALVLPYFCADVPAEPAVGTSACVDADGRALVVACEPGAVSDGSEDLGALVLRETCAEGWRCELRGGAPTCVSPS